MEDAGPDESGRGYCVSLGPLHEIVLKGDHSDAMADQQPPDDQNEPPTPQSPRPSRIRDIIAVIAAGAALTSAVGVVLSNIRIRGLDVQLEALAGEVRTERRLLVPLIFGELSASLHDSSQP